MRSVVLSLLLVGCGAQPGGPTASELTTTSEPATSEPATSEPTPSPVATEVPVASAGPARFHLPGPIDVVNLELDEAAGTFRWGVTGCDYAHFDRGLVRREGAELVLSAAPGATLTWFHSPGFRNEVTELRARRSQAGLTITGTIRGEPVTQAWDLGGTCPDCGHLGPDTTHPCDAPFLGE